MNMIRLLSTVGVVAGFLAVFSMLLFAPRQNHDDLMVDLIAMRNEGYGDGANDALDTLLLLWLENDMQGTSMTWAAMSELVCERMNIERRK